MNQKTPTIHIENESSRKAPIVNIELYQVENKLSFIQIITPF